MDDGELAAENPGPSIEVIQQFHRRRRRIQHRRIDPIRVEQPEEYIRIAQRHRIEIIEQEAFSVQFRTTIGEGRHARPDHVAAKDMTVEHTLRFVIPQDSDCFGILVLVSGPDFLGRQERTRNRDAGDQDEDRDGGRSSRRNIVVRRRRGPAKPVRQRGQQDDRQQQHRLVDVTNMAERHVQETEGQQDSRRRQCHAVIQRNPDRQQQTSRERVETREIHRSPFLKPRQRFTEPKNSLCRQQRIPAIWRQATGRQRADAEQAPVHDDCLALRRAGIPQGVECDGGNQHQAEHEAAVQVGPQHHERQQPERRCLASIGGEDQATDPGDRNRQGQDVRPGQNVWHQQDERDHRYEAGIAARQTPTENNDQQRERGRNRQRSHHEDAAPAGIIVSACKQDLREPRRRDPRLARFGEGVNVDLRHGAVIDDPLPHLDLPVRVGVEQHLVALNQHEHAHDRGYPGPCGQERNKLGKTASQMVRLDIVGAGDTHGVGLSANADAAPGGIVRLRRSNQPNHNSG